LLHPRSRSLDVARRTPYAHGRCAQLVQRPRIPGEISLQKGFT
jgi:hypothetical protein